MSHGLYQSPASQLANLFSRSETSVVHVAERLKGNLNELPIGYLNSAQTLFTSALKYVEGLGREDLEHRSRRHRSSGFLCAVCILTYTPDEWAKDAPTAKKRLTQYLACVNNLEHPSGETAQDPELVKELVTLLEAIAQRGNQEDYAEHCAGSLPGLNSNREIIRSLELPPNLRWL